MRKQLFLTLFAVALPLATAHADNSAAQDSYAPPSCHKPILPSAVRRADDTTEFDEKVDAYKDCINNYVSAQNDLAKKHIEAGNAAAAEFNDFSKKVNEFNESRANQ